MTSDYIYIFCIPGSGSSETRVSSAFSAPTELSHERSCTRSTTVFPRTSAEIPSTTNDNTNSEVHSSRGATQQAASWSRRINRPQSAIMDVHVPHDWAPLPARQRNNSHISSFRASFPDAAGSVRTQNVTNTGQSNITSSENPLFVEDSFQYETCNVPTYGTLPSRSSPEVTLSEFYALRWSPRATSSPVRESRHGLCDARAKDCWRRVFSRDCCLRCCVTVTTFRWLLLFFASVGAGCILSGVVLGVLYISLGISFLVLSIMFMGLGIMLIIVVSVGWRCTPTGHEPCHLLFNFDRYFDMSRSQRGGQSGGRSDHSLDQSQWFGGMIYPEFRSRTPPPTYIASVMDYEDHRHQRRHSCEDVAVSVLSNVEPVPATPPPTYHSNHSAVHGMPVYCPRALRSHPPTTFVSNDSTQPSTTGSTSNVVVRVEPSSEVGVVGKCHVAGCSTDIS